MMNPPKETQEKQRPRWDNKVQYLLSCIGFAVGLGNVWRFPYLCQIYGGGAFLIPYAVALVFEGLPLLYLELAIGQRFRNGSIGVWNSISPYLGGIGIASMMISFLVSMFYNAVLAWVLWYFGNSFLNPLPWAQCPPGDDNTGSGLNEECLRATPVSYFWYHETLNITPDVETSGTLQWWLVVCLACAWLILFICFIRGIKSMGKAVYVTATFPYLVLTIFLVRALTLPGATVGLAYLITPDWEKLKNPEVWLDAATQIFFSLSVAFGGLIAYSSYSKEKDNCERDALLVAVINSATSLYASIPIFGILGFKATNGYKSCLTENILALKEHNVTANITVENYQSKIQELNPQEISGLELKQCDLQTFLDKSASGPGLAFIVFTEAVIEMPGSQWWAVLFFIMLFSLGLSSMFGILEGILTPINDLKLVPKWAPQGLVTAVVCSATFSISLIFTLGSGAYWVDIFNGYAGSLPLLIIAFLELVGVIYVYGLENFSDDIKFMTGKRPNLYWKACWTVISPLLLLVVFVAYVVLQAQQQPTYGAWNPAHKLFPQAEVKLYPRWVFATIIILCVLPVISIPLVPLYRLIYCRVKRSTHPGPGPDPRCNKATKVEMRLKRALLVRKITFVPENTHFS